jgi:DNA-binding NarL/FixJ family response regulator
VSPQQAKVLTLVAEGLSNKEIARRAGISPSTVKVHLERAYARLSAPERVAAANRFIELSGTPT